MFIGAASDISGDAGVKRTAGAVRHDIDPAAAHLGDGTRSNGRRKGVDGGVKPGHDVTSLGRSRKNAV